MTKRIYGQAAQKPVLTQSQWEKAEVTDELKWKEKNKNKITTQHGDNMWCAQPSLSPSYGGGIVKSKMEAWEM